MTGLSIIVAGFGGQGILFLGEMLAYGGMIEGKQVTWFPSYGAEMRGGTANCTAVISDKLIGSPIVKNPDILIAMNDASLRRFMPRLKSSGTLLFDSSLIRSPQLRSDVTCLAVPASEIAAAQAEPCSACLPRARVKAANMVMLGVLIGTKGILKPESILTALEELTPSARKRSLPENRAAIMKGMSYHEDSARNNS